MIEQKLIQRELENSRYPLPLPADLMPAIEEFKKTHFKDDAAYRRALAEVRHHRTGSAGRSAVGAHLLRFIEMRFETGVQDPRQEIADYARQNKLSVRRRRTRPDLRSRRQADGSVAARRPPPH